LLHVFSVVKSLFSKDIQYSISGNGGNILENQSFVALPIPKLCPETVFCPSHTRKIYEHIKKTKNQPDSIHRIDVIIQDIDLCIQRNGDLSDLSIDGSYCLKRDWYWPFALWLLKKLMASPTKRISYRDLLACMDNASSSY
jgi:hypothetical protein